MRRREFVGALAGAAVAWPKITLGQATRIRRIGLLTAPLTNPISTPGYRAFLAELEKAGFREGSNLSIELRSNEQDWQAIEAAAAELVSLDVELIFTAGAGQQTEAALAASAAIPIVILAVNYDPIARGHVSSLSRPGGNVTGVFLRQTEVAEKQVELLTQAFPDKKTLAVLWDDASVEQHIAAQRRAGLLGLGLHSVKLENPPYDFNMAFQRIASARPDMLLVLSSQFFARFDKQIAELAVEHRLPTMFVFQGYVKAGGLMSFGADFTAMFQQSAAYVVKLLNGAKPSDLPVELPNKFDLVVNLKTARALGIEMQPAILLRASEVIE
jgi:putative ABC transport system substrate-binding protein